VCHSDWLQSTLHNDHPLFGSNLYTLGFVHKLKEKVLKGYSKCPTTKLTATGVPQFIHILLNTTASRDQVLQELRNTLEDLPVQVKNIILQNFQVHGALPVTMADIKASLAQAASRIIGEIHISRTNNPLPTITIQPNSPVIANNNGTINDLHFHHWDWNGWMAQMVPEGFTIPKHSVAMMWTRWHHGDATHNIGPYKKLEPFNLTRRGDRINLTRLRMVMRHLEHLAREHGQLAPELGSQLSRAKR